MASLTTLAKQVLPDPVVDLLVMAHRYRRRHGRWPNLVRPRTFTEKVIWRNLFDRDPLLSRLSDKLAARDYVQSTGAPVALPQLFWRTDDPRDVPFEALPEAFVAKPNHGSGWVSIVRDKSSLDRDQFIATCQLWLQTNYYALTREKIYQAIKPTILIEELLEESPGVLAFDYKFFVFESKVQYVTVTTDRFDDHHLTMFDRDWRPVPVEIYGMTTHDHECPRPPHLAAMIEIAERLAGGLDFVRVDLYDTPKGIYFGEMTFSPWSGMTPFTPVSFDYQLGALWPGPRKSRKGNARTPLAGPPVAPASLPG